MKHIRSLFLCINLLVFSLQCRAQMLDTVLFASMDEYRLFSEYTDTSAFDLLYIIDQDDFSLKNQYKKSYYQFLDQLSTKLSKKEKRNATLIYERIHDQYFRKYIENPDFADIFTKGEYNCVTATALYAIGLAYFQIPYEIRELPSHVYLVVYPNTERIIFEATTPEDGLSVFNQKQVDAYRESLVNNKILTEQEAQQEHFFQDYMFADSIISLQQLVGIQYYNNSIQFVLKENMKQALKQAEKAYLYHDGIHVGEWMNYLLLVNLTYSAEKEMDELCKTMYKVYSYNKELPDLMTGLTELYLPIIEGVLKRKNGEQLLLQLQRCFAQEINAKEVVDELEFMTHFFLSRYYFDSAKFSQSLQSLQLIYSEDKSNLNLLVRDCIVRRLDDIADPEHGLDSLLYYQNSFPFAKEDNVILGVKSWYLLRMAYTHFELEEIDEGMFDLNQFRQEFKSNKDVKYPEEMLGYTFGSISSYFFRNEDYEKAKSFLLEGLEYTPYSLVLKRKLKLLDNFTKDE